MTQQEPADRENDHAIVLAGGRGLRLLPHTKDRPKALISLGGRPLLEIILCQIARAGFRRVTLCTGHLGDMIREHVGDGRRLGLDVDYTVDTRPLGTAGPLRLVQDWRRPALVMNCDILTTMDFRRIHTRHGPSGCALTVVATQRELPVDSGVLAVSGERVRGIWEKPLVQMDVAAGVYVADPCVRACLREGERTDMPELVAALLARGMAVGAHRWPGEWRDIGTVASLEEASRELAADPDRYLSGGDAAPAPTPVRADDGRARLRVAEAAGTGPDVPGR